MELGPTKQEFKMPQTIILNAVNYFTWQKKLETVLAQKGFIHHIKYQDFAAYNKATKVTTKQEQRYKKQQEKILGTKFKTQAEQDEVLEKLDDKFHSDLSKWSENEANEETKWNNEEQRIFGILRATIEDGYWTSVKNLKTAFEMWNQLKLETQQNEAGNKVALLAEFFHLKIEQTELLTQFIARAQSITDRIADLGINFLTPSLICYRILIEMPQQYDAITQPCFQIPESKLSLAVIKSKFAIEDSRKEAVKKNNNNNNKNHSKISNQEEAYLAQGEERKCSNCPNRLPKTAKTYQHRCRSCQEIWLSEKKKEESTTQKKEESNLIMIM
jgi:hypothetical protein